MEPDPTAGPEEGTPEAIARAAAARLRLLIAQAPTSIAMFDSEMRFLAYSRQFHEDSRLPPGSLVGQSLYALFPELSERWREIHRRCLAGARERADLEPVEYPDGSVRWLRWEFAPWREADGSIGGLVFCSDDLTRLKATERALEDQRALLASIIDGTPSLIAAVDAEGRFILVNEASARFHGRPKEAFLGQTAAVGLSPADLARVTAAQKEVMATGKAQFGEMRGMIGGEERSVLTARFPLRDAAGRIYGTATIATDITAQKRIEAELRASEQRAQQALAALEQAQEVNRRNEERLREVEKLQAIGQLAGGIAHDFNNILTIILAGSEQLSRALEPGDPLRQDVEEIQRAGERAAVLTRQLLAFGRRQVLAPRMVCLNELLRGAERMLRRLIREDIELHLVLAPVIDPCLLDPGQLEQVLLNLAVNARDAMPHGGSIQIETANVVLDAADVAGNPDAKPGPHVRLTIADTGVGMTPEIRARVFEPFFTTKEPGAGTGLGLATVYGIVRQSGGTIAVDSEPGRGTSFTIDFPSAAGLAPRREADARRPAQARGRETILLVEDEAPVRTVVGTILRRAGYRVIAAENGGEALLICEQHGEAIELLLTDVIMPKLNGRKVAQRLQQIRPDLRVLFMSGYTEDPEVLAGGIDFIAKPITADLLLPKVREVLDRPVRALR